MINVLAIASVPAVMLLFLATAVATQWALYFAPMLGWMLP